ncbi:Uu.00g129630.m01.CDS01 [Anthostomella pinea]|uniref:Uu.00g129630.m01.CDS01 n=1 Tax=Anthostomella pinea TaxID=933095 RepID=A0AAI8VII0_9PEZI|nr:Uu.00g129630.m01.CDS01 [Anthostomella pinea]
MRFSLLVVATTALTGAQAAVPRAVKPITGTQDIARGLLHHSGSEATVDACARSYSPPSDSNAEGPSSKLRRAGEEPESAKRTGEKEGTVKRGTIYRGNPYICVACDGSHDKCNCEETWAPLGSRCWIPAEEDGQCSCPG